MNPNVGLFLRAQATRNPDRPAIVDAGRDELVVCYGELDRHASRIAASLIERGLGRGDRVAICTANGLDFVTAWFGAIYAGCATLPIAANSPAREVAFRLEHAGCGALLTDAERLEVAREAVARAGKTSALLSVADALENAQNEASPAQVDGDSFAMLLYTSGTTGAAKCACITHASLDAHTRSLTFDTIRLSESDRVLGTLPLTHSYGIRTTLLVPFCAGASTVFLPKFSPRRTLELCKAHEVTWLPGVPTMFIAWGNQEGVAPPGSLRWCMSAGAPLIEDVRLRAEATLGAPVRQAYGLTEANLTAVNAPPDEAVAGSSGKPVAGVAIRVADDRGRELAPGSHGEVLVRGPNVMAGYLDDPLATRHVMRGGWLHTGDIGFVDPEGRLSIADRSKDLILRGAASIYPSEVESVLTHHPAVRQAAVVGKAHDYYGEEVVALVVLRAQADAATLDEWVRERIASYKAPRFYAFVGSLPQSASGKTLKRVLRSQVESGELELQPSPMNGSAQ